MSGQHDDSRVTAQQWKWSAPAGMASYVDAGSIVALHIGLLPEELREKAAGHPSRTIEERDWHLWPVLAGAGHPDVAHRLLDDEPYPSWGYTTKNGATTIRELWDGWTEENGFHSPIMSSFNHYHSPGSAVEWLYRHVSGIDVDPEGVERLSKDGEEIVLSVGSGGYEFVGGAAERS